MKKLITFLFIATIIGCKKESKQQQPQPVNQRIEIITYSNRDSCWMSITLAANHTAFADSSIKHYFFDEAASNRDHYVNVQPCFPSDSCWCKVYLGNDLKINAKYGGYFFY